MGQTPYKGPGRIFKGTGFVQMGKPDLNGPTSKDIASDGDKYWSFIQKLVIVNTCCLLCARYHTSVLPVLACSASKQPMRKE